MRFYLFFTVPSAIAVLAACASEVRDGFDPGAGPPGSATAPGSSGSAGSSGSSGSSGGGSSSSSGGSSSSSSSGGGDGGSDAGNLPAGPTPWTSPCTDNIITSNQVLTHFAPAATTATFGTVWADARKRQCQDQTGCQGWQPASSADLYKISWTGGGYTFINPTTLSVPGTGTITCKVPGPSCELTIAAMTSNVYPPEQARPLGITPRVAGGQVQVGSWSANPSGDYVQYTSSVVTKTCLWGSMSGRVYGANATYVETELVVWGSF